MMKNKIRILHVAQAAGGVDRYIQMLLKYLDKEKVENILVCSQDFHKDDYNGLVDYFEQIEMTRAIGGNDLKAIKEVRALIKKYNPDIVYAHSSKAGAIARVADIGLKNHCVFKIRKFGVSDVIGLTAAGKTSFFYVDKDRLVRFNGFFPKPQSGTYLILDEGGYQVAGQKGTWLVSDEVEVDGQRFVQMRSEQTKNPPPSIILHESGAFVTQTALGFDGEATRKMSAFLQGPKPELLHHQKFFENGTAERAKESGTEQNYNMIDGCVNNVPKKPRRIGGRWSVLDRLHIKQAERRQKDNAPQQEQERSRKS